MLHIIYEMHPRATYKSTALMLLLTLILPCPAGGAPTAPLNQSAQEYDVYDVHPPSGVPGREYSINIISHNPNIKRITATTQVVPPSGITISNIQVSNNGISPDRDSGGRSSWSNAVLAKGSAGSCRRNHWTREF